MPMTMRKVLDFLLTETPRSVTDEGSMGRAWFTRFCTSTWARSGLVPMLKNTLSVMLPVPALVEDI